MLSEPWRMATPQGPREFSIAILSVESPSAARAIGGPWLLMRRGPWRVHSAVGRLLIATECGRPRIDLMGRGR